MICEITTLKHAFFLLKTWQKFESVLFLNAKNSFVGILSPIYWEFSQNKPLISLEGDLLFTRYAWYLQLLDTCLAVTKEERNRSNVGFINKILGLFVYM